MSRTTLVPRTVRFHASRTLGLCFLLPIMGCAASNPQLAATQPQLTAAPLYTGTVAAIRPETSSPDATGAVQQIMSILGQPPQPPLDASEIVLRLTDNTIRTNVQAPSPGLAAGSKAIVTPPPNVLIQPD